MEEPFETLEKYHGSIASGDVFLYRIRGWDSFGVGAVAAVGVPPSGIHDALLIYLYKVFVHESPVSTDLSMNNQLISPCVVATQFWKIGVFQPATYTGMSHSMFADRHAFSVMGSSTGYVDQNGVDCLLSGEPVMTGIYTVRGLANRISSSIEF
ncbi:MAG: hypothetical protein ACX94C_14325 [Phycisphaerales bacterium]